MSNVIMNRELRVLQDIRNIIVREPIEVGDRLWHILEFIDGMIIHEEE